MNRQELLRVYFQSTPPRRRRLIHFLGGWQYGRFSIHASAKEATYGICGTNKCKRFSIHASAKEATYFCHKKAILITFQSTPPRRRRRHVLLLIIPLLFFNPRLREGGDVNSPEQNFVLEFFQSTPPRRRRHVDMQFYKKQCIFNPRLREGGDDDSVATADSLGIFNPRLREGGDQR